MWQYLDKTDNKSQLHRIEEDLFFTLTKKVRNEIIKIQLFILGALLTSKI